MSTAPLAPFDGAHFVTLVRESGLSLGEPLALTLETGSTNDDALAAARAGAPNGALFVTEAQRAGRGRRGNSWHSAPGAGLLFSLVLRPNVAVERASALALVAGLAMRAAVAELLAARGLAAKVLVKWPNDVVIKGDRLRKLAGVLVESQVRGNELGAVVVGVGLNVGRLGLPADVEQTATSLAELGVETSQETWIREGLLKSFLCALSKRLEGLEHPEMPLKTLVTELNAFDALKGAKLAVGATTGTGAGIDAHGFLLLETETGETARITSGTVTLKH